MTHTLASVTDLEWSEMAKESGLTGRELKGRVSRRLRVDGEGIAASPPRAGALAVEGLCQTTPFSAMLWHHIGCNGQITLCGPELQWTGTIAMKVHLVDVPLGTVTQHFDARTPQVFGTLSLPILRARFVIGVSKDRWCFTIKGSFGHLTFNGWEDRPVNRTLFCFGEI